MCLSNVVFHEEHFKLLQTKRKTNIVKNMQYAVLSLCREIKLTLLFIALVLINNVDILLTLVYTLLHLCCTVEWYNLFQLPRATDNVLGQLGL